MAATTSATSVKKSVKKSNGKKNGIGGFIIDKVDVDIMLAYIKDNDLSEELGGVDDEMSPEQIGVALASHFAATIPVKNQVKCDECSGISSKDEAKCPFCGDDGEVREDAPAEASDDSGAEVAHAAPESESEVEEDADEEDEEEPVEEEEEEDGDIPDTGEESTPSAQAAPGGNKAKKKGTKNMSTTELVNGAGKKTKNGKSTALAKGTTGTAVSAKDLDKARDEVIEIKSRGAQNFWELGKKLAEISKKSLWKLRVNPETGKNKYNGFDAFVIAELNMTPMHAYRAIEIGEQYKTADEVRALGTTKASLILQAAPADRKKLAAKAKAGATKRQIEKDVKESRAKHGSPKKSQQAKAGAKGGKKKAATTAVRSEKISVASIEGTKTIKLYKKPDSLKGVVFSELDRAAKIGDGPIGRYEMGNGVVQYFHVRPGEDGWTLRIETRRESSE